MLVIGEATFKGDGKGDDCCQHEFQRPKKGEEKTTPGGHRIRLPGEKKSLTIKKTTNVRVWS